LKLNLPRWGFSSKTTSITARVLKLGQQTNIHLLETTFIIARKPKSSDGLALIVVYVGRGGHSSVQDENWTEQN